MGHCSDHGDWRRTPCHPGVEPEPFTSAEGRGAWVPRAAGEAAAVPAPGADSRTPRPPDTGSWCHRATSPAARHKFSLAPPPVWITHTSQMWTPRCKGKGLPRATQPRGEAGSPGQQSDPKVRMPLPLLLGRCFFSPISTHRSPQGQDLPGAMP